MLDLINYLSKYDFGLLSSEDIVDRLHEIRKVRNRVAHGDVVSYEQYKQIYNLLIEDQVFEFISWELSNIEASYS